MHHSSSKTKSEERKIMHTKKQIINRLAMPQLIVEMIRN